jgi:hypothetical protein
MEGNNALLYQETMPEIKRNSEFEVAKYIACIFPVRFLYMKIILRVF